LSCPGTRRRASADVPNYIPLLVIIDVQQGMFAFRRPRYQGEEVVERIAG
jgi:hypothetical protein